MNPGRFLLLILVILVSLPATVPAVPAYPGSIETLQPDGSLVTVRMHGDEWYHFYESDEGYAIVQDPDRWWVYADVNAAGEYVPTSYRVGREDQGALRFRSRVGLHLRETSPDKVNRRELFYERTMPGILEQAAQLNKSAKAVTMNVPVILVQYADYSGSQSTSSFTNMMNQTGYNGSGSFQDYYQEVSYNNLTVVATVVGWYTAPNNRDYYKYGTGTTARYDAARALARSAVDAAETAGFNWAPFDNDGDGNVDVTFIVHQGPGAECNITNNTDYIWSHAWFLNVGTDLSVTYDTKLIDRYVMQPEMDCSGGHVDIGVFCHEFGHALGLPDLYDVDGTSSGIGNWCLMSGGVWGGDGASPQTPVHLSAWCKIQNGWLTPTVVSANATSMPIPRAEFNATAYKLWTNGIPGLQYILVENRQKTGFDVNLPTGGLAIWHIDENQRRIDNSDNANENHKLVDLEEADGSAHLDAGTNDGDSGDLYPGSTMNTGFNATSTPNSDDYNNVATQVCVQNISTPNATMYADFCIGTGAAGINLLVRDCPADVGAEPDAPCSFNWVRSPDLWIDNNDDGIIDPMIMGQINHLYIRAWNVGTNTATNATVKCWFANASMGMKFGPSIPNAPILDAVTGLNTVTFSSMGPVVPTPNGQGYRTYFNWLVPQTSARVPNFCYGCVIENAQDPQMSTVPILENNLAQSNWWGICYPAGIGPGKDAARVDDAVFEQDIRIVNPLDLPSAFLVTVEGLPPDWELLPLPEYETPILMPEEEIVIPLDIIKYEPAHRDSAQVEFKLWKLPEMELAGAIGEDLAIDDLPPVDIKNWKVVKFEPMGDNLIRPMPTCKLSWEDPEIDTGGFPERIRFFEIYSGADPGQAMSLDPALLRAETFGDDEPDVPGFQHYIYDPIDPPTFYSVVPVDMAGNRGAPSPAMEPQEPTSAVRETPGVPTLSQNYPNPFNPQTTIDFTLTRGEHVRISVFDSAGQLVKVLSDELYEPGTWSVTWNGTDHGGKAVSSGVYFLKLSSASLEDSRKMTLVR